MTKKIFVLLVTLLLIGPTIGSACNCCPPGQATASGSAILESGCATCCSVFEVNRDQSDLSRPGNSSLNSQETWLLKFLSVAPAALLWEPSQIQDRSLSEGPPLLGLGTPLYLSNQILRL